MLQETQMVLYLQTENVCRLINSDVLKYMTCEGPSLKIGYCHWATQMSTKNGTQSLQTVILKFLLADVLKCLQKTYSNVFSQIRSHNCRQKY